MKRPSELAVELSQLEASQPYVHGQTLSVFHKTEFLERVIVDAMKEGARRAATEVMMRYADVQTSAPKLKRDLNQAILFTAENWTTKDL